jgi:hypothetical protein
MAASFRVPAVMGLFLFANVISTAQSTLERSLVEGALAARDYWLFESGPVRPLAMSHDGQRLYAANIPDGKLEIFAITVFGDTPRALAASANGEKVYAGINTVPYY